MDQTLFELVEFTNRNIFLTGKAGTGKTTFLNNFVKKTEKKYIVVAPTGIAAINAGGVTIHSMFGLPLRTFIPTLERIDQNLGNNIPDLMQHFKYRKDKMKLLREIEIIIIDEVSMLRADVLDMIDFSLRHVRKNQQKFGGVQMLFIGDLYQLPPVVRDENFLQMYYPSAFFFDSFALRDETLLTIELQTVYRQKDEDFLEILNHVREGIVDQEDLEVLNKRYLPDFEPEDEKYVFLTSHNRMADEINQKKLKALPGKSFLYNAEIVGDFRESQYPNELKLELKKGSQVMFIRNDASGDHRYYNGKLAEVVHLDEKEVWVRIEGEEEDYQLKKEVWENKTYSLDQEKNIKEKVLGSFEQFPLRLAWAVTIHKSQGLTFDRLIIDAGKSFASGQVYVALSRCRTLEGIVLKSKISKEVIFSNHQVEDFQEKTKANDKITEILKTEKYDFAIQRVLRKVNCSWFLAGIEQWYSAASHNKGIDKQKVAKLYKTLKTDAQKLREIDEKFEKILLQLTSRFLNNEIEWTEVEKKALGAVSYFFSNVNEKFFSPLKDQYAETKGVRGFKQYNELLRGLLDDIKDYLDDLKQSKLFDTPLFTATHQQEVSLKVAKIPSHVITYQLFEEGKSVAEIAKERALVKETIFGHLAKYANQGLLDLSRIIEKEKIKTFEKLLNTNPNCENLTDWKNLLPENFEFYEIRILIGHFLSKQEEKQ